MKLKLRYISDIHLEFLKEDMIRKFMLQIKPPINNSSIIDENEVCILAGDIGNPYTQKYNMFMDFINNNFKKSFVITGNHEYYNNNKTIEETNIYLANYFKKYNNISFLNNSYEYYNGYNFIGTTLWSKITNPAYNINDISHIRNFDYLKCNGLNLLAVDFLEDTLDSLAPDKNNNNIIITHHVPSNDLIDIKYKTQNMIRYNQWFYCDMDEFITKNKDKIGCWIYGHTHTANDIKLHDVQFLCNPIGYPNENEKLNFNKIFTLP